MNRFIYIFVVILIGAFGQLNAQNVNVSGKILSEDQLPIPFVNIHVQGTQLGTLSDIEGKFKLVVPKEFNDRKIIFSHIEYKPDTLLIADLANKNSRLSLTEKQVMLDVVKVLPAENPAWAIIRKMLENRANHDPAQLESYKLKQYHRLMATQLITDTDSMDMDKKNKAGFYLNAHSFISETITEINYAKPGFYHETVIANQFSGLDTPPFIFNAADFQPFSAYADNLSFLETSYLHPVSSGTFRRYDFEWYDTLYTEEGKLYAISFEPLKGRNFSALKGYMYVSADDYAIHTFYAEPAVLVGKVNFSIKQNYRKTNGRWFPHRSQVDYYFAEVLKKSDEMLIRSTYEVTDVSYNEFIDKKKLGKWGITTNNDIYITDTAFWNQVRPIPLTTAELNTFKNFELLPERRKILLNGIMNATSSLIYGKIPIKSFNLDATHLLRINNYEGYRWGLGLETNDKFIKNLSVGGYFGYGVRDAAFKYGGNLRLDLHQDTNTKLNFAFSQDVVEPGNTLFEEPPGFVSDEGISLRRFYTERMDSVRSLSVSLETQASRKWRFHMNYQRQFINSTYNYIYTQDDLALSAIDINEVQFQARFAPNEFYTKIGTQYAVRNISYPVIKLSVNKAFQAAGSQNWDYTRFYFEGIHQLKLKTLGVSKFSLKSGYLLGDAPYQKLFNSPAALQSGELGLLVNNHFQTMGLYEFANDAFAALFWRHDFGQLLPKPYKYSAPTFSLYQRGMIGTIDQSPHSGIVVQAPDKGYFETGATLDNLLRVDVTYYYMSLGFGAFYRYGNYQLPQFNQNMAYILSLLVTI